MVAGKYCPLSTIFSLPHTCISRQEELAADMNTPVDAQSSQGDQLLQFSSQRTDKANGSYQTSAFHLSELIYPKLSPKLSPPCLFNSYFLLTMSSFHSFLNNAYVKPLHKKENSSVKTVVKTNINSVQLLCPLYSELTLAVVSHHYNH